MIRELTANGVECNDITKLKYPDGKTFYMRTIIIKDYPERMSKTEGNLTYGKMIEALGIQ